MKFVAISFGVVFLAGCFYILRLFIKAVLSEDETDNEYAGVDVAKKGSLDE